MSTAVLVWAAAAKWIFGILLVVLLVLAVDVIKRAIVGKGELVSWGGTHSRPHPKKGA